MSRPGRDDEGINLQLREGRDRDGIVANDGHVRTQESQMLVEIPSEGVEVVDHEHVDGTGEMGWEGHCRDG